MPPQLIRAVNASAGCIDGVRKIAVLRANAIGDFIFTLPALDALRDAYPSAEITLLGLPWHAAFLAGRPGPIDRVEVIPSIPGVGEPEDATKDEAAEREFFERMRAEQFDLAVQLHGGGRNSNPIVRELGARVTIGAVTPDAPPLDRSLRYVRWRSETARMLEIVALAGAEPVTLIPTIRTTDGDHAEVDRLGFPVGRPIVALNPGATDPERRWPPERFAAVGDAAINAGVRVVITGAEWDAPLAKAIRAKMTSQAIDTTGRLSLGGLAALFERCAVVVSNDTGPLHLAMAVGAATVGLYWCFNYVTAAPLVMNRHRPVISWQTACPVCGVDRAIANCGDHPSFLANLPAKAAIQPMLELLENV